MRTVLAVTGNDDLHQLRLREQGENMKIRRRQFDFDFLKVGFRINCVLENEKEREVIF